MKNLTKKGVLGNCPGGAEKGPKMGQNRGSPKSAKNRVFFQKNEENSIKMKIMTKI